MVFGTPVSPQARQETEMPPDIASQIAAQGDPNFAFTPQGIAAEFARIDASNGVPATVTPSAGYPAGYGAPVGQPTVPQPTTPMIPAVGYSPQPWSQVGAGYPSPASQPGQLPDPERVRLEEELRTARSRISGLEGTLGQVSEAAARAQTEQFFERRRELDPETAIAATDAFWRHHLGNLQSRTQQDLQQVSQTIYDLVVDRFTGELFEQFPNQTPEQRELILREPNPDVRAAHAANNHAMNTLLRNLGIQNAANLYVAAGANRAGMSQPQPAMNPGYNQQQPHAAAYASPSQPYAMPGSTGNPVIDAIRAEPWHVMAR